MLISFSTYPVEEGTCGKCCPREPLMFLGELDEVVDILRLRAQDIADFRTACFSSIEAKFGRNISLDFSGDGGIDDCLF